MGHILKQTLAVALTLGLTGTVAEAETSRDNSGALIAGALAAGTLIYILNEDRRKKKRAKRQYHHRNDLHSPRNVQALEPFRRCLRQRNRRGNWVTYFSARCVNRLEARGAYVPPNLREHLRRQAQTRGRGHRFPDRFRANHPGPNRFGRHPNYAAPNRFGRAPGQRLVTHP
jgi:hypothetical protein